MDGNAATKDGLPGDTQGLPSAGAGATPSADGKGGAITVTQEELTRMVQEAADKRHATLDKRIAELTGQLSGFDNLKSELESAKKLITDLEQMQQEKELAGAKDNPSELALIKQRQELLKQQRMFEQKQREFETERTKHQAELSEAKKVRLEVTAESLVKEFPGIDKSLLLKFGGDTPETMRANAVELHKALLAAKGQTPPSGDTKTNNPRPGVPGAGAAAELTGLALCERELSEVRPK